MQRFSPSERVDFRYTNSTLTFEFFDRHSWQVRILNLTGKKGTLSARVGEGENERKWMDDIRFSIYDGEQTDASWQTFTTSQSPFRAVSDCGFSLPMRFLLDENKNKLSITIGG